MDPRAYERLVRELENEGLTRSDAQAAVDAAESITGTEVAAFRFEPDQEPQSKAVTDRVYAECGNVTGWRMYYPADEPEYMLYVAMTERASRPSLMKARRIALSAGGRELDPAALPATPDGVSLVDTLRVRRIEHALFGLMRGEQESRGRMRTNPRAGWTLDAAGRVQPHRRPQG